MTERLPLFPLRSLLLPHTDLGVHVFEPCYRDLISYCLENAQPFGVAYQPEGSDRTFDVGVIAGIVGYARLPDGRYLLEIEGGQRFSISDMRRDGSYPTVVAEPIPDPIGNFARARVAGEEVEHAFFTYRSLSGDGDLPVRLPVDPVARSYVVASLLDVTATEKQTLLETPSADERLEIEIGILERETTLIDLLRSEER